MPIKTKEERQMIIVKETYRNRNDFTALYKCDQCGHEQAGWGYSDAFFYGTVLPNAICPKCGRNSKGETAEELKKRVGRLFVLDLH